MATPLELLREHFAFCQHVCAFLDFWTSHATSLRCLLFGLFLLVDFRVRLGHFDVVRNLDGKLSHPPPPSRAQSRRSPQMNLQREALLEVPSNPSLFFVFASSSCSTIFDLVLFHSARVCQTNAHFIPLFLLSVSMRTARAPPSSAKMHLVDVATAYVSL